MVYYTLGLSQIGGKYRARKLLNENTPTHRFFLSGFAGSCVYELNKPRSQYELFNDIDSNYIHYYLMVRKYPKEFDELKKGIMGIVSKEIFERIENGDLKAKNEIERAYFFYYLNKLGQFGNSKAIIDEQNNECEIENYQVNYKGINPKDTRPHTNNDCGLLTPLDPKSLERARYVQFTNYDFRRVYELFHKAYHIKREYTKECFVYFDPPYPDTESYYFYEFTKKDHLQLIELCLNSPFNVLITIGKSCQFYLDIFSEANWKIKDFENKYSTNAQNPKDEKEFMIMNYDIRETGIMKIEKQDITLDNYI